MYQLENSAGGAYGQTLLEPATPLFCKKAEPLDCLVRLTVVSDFELRF